MVTPEMRASALEAIEEERRREWRASRSPFQRRGTNGHVTLGNTAAGVVFATATGSDLERIKRLQVKLMLPKSGTAYGMMGLFRQPEGSSVDWSELEFGSPSLLRPVQFLGNPDHATYWDLYLPALNLADGGQLLWVYAGSPALTVTYMARWVHERGLEG